MNQLTEILWTRAMLDNDLFDAFEGLPRSAVALCAVWLAHASAFGVILWAMRWNQVRRGNAGMVQMFD
jgi:hypothetical protein